MLIPPGSFLRNIPQSLNVRESITLDTIRVASEMVELSILRAKTTALNISQNTPGSHSRGWITLLLSDCWSAILHLDSIRRTISDYKIEDAATTEFISKTEDVRKLRNSFQHIQSNLGNRAAATSSLFPQYGSVSWVYWLNENAPDIKLFQCNPNAEIDQTGSKMSIAIPSAQDIREGISWIKLQAFEITLDIDEMWKALEKLVHFLNTAFAERCRVTFQELSEEKKIPFEKIWTARSGPLIFSYPATFSEDGTKITMPKTPHAGYYAERFN